jgi:Zn-dependent protease
MSSSVVLIVLNVLLFIPAVILHEVSHGYMALMLGDTTARDAGRLTLNPIAHVDLWGTIILPLMMFLVVGFAIGYAKPVPIDPRRMTRVPYQTALLLTGAAGPVTNVLLAIASGICFRIVGALGAPIIVQYIFGFFTFINLVLAFFNLVPIPPLDGSRVVQYFLKGDALRAYASLERWGIVIVLALVFILPQILPSFDLIGAYFRATVYPLAQFLAGPQLMSVLARVLG